MTDGQAFGALLFSTASQLLILVVIYFYQREVAHASAEQERQMDLLSEALREIDHRTKNNYQTIVAVILMQAQRAGSCRRSGRRCTTRRTASSAVSLASDQLALRSEDLGTVRLGDHLRELCDQIRRGMSRDGVHVHCEVADVTASAEKAIFISIIVNELVTNALKHAFRDRSEGLIRVSSKHNGNGLAIVVEDDGAGLEPSGRAAAAASARASSSASSARSARSTRSTSSPAGTVHMILVPEPRLTAMPGDDPRRHRRLDLPAVARDFLPARTRPVEGAGVRRADLRRDRDQRHLLRPPEPEELGGMGGGGARRFPVRHQGLALLRHPAAPRRRRRGHRQFPRPGPVARSAPSSGRCCGCSPRAASSTATTSPPSSTCSRASSTASPLRHVIEPRHDSFRDERFFDLCRAHDVAIVFGDDDEFPCIDADTASFAYARLQRMREDVADRL